MTDLLSAPPLQFGGDPSGGRAPLVLVAHRGPVRFSERDGRQIARRNAGGLVTALESVIREVDQTVRWVCAPASEEDRLVAREAMWTPFATDDSLCRVRMLDIDRTAHHDFYNVIANPLLWFVQHGLYGTRVPRIGRRERAAWGHGYVGVNRAFARALRDPAVAPIGSTVMVHDYHFYLAPGMLRPARPDVFIHHFTHIPWPEPDVWRVLPAFMRDAIFRGLLGSDIIGFHTASHVDNFVRGCDELLGLPVDYATASVGFGDREVVVRHYPISINVDALRTLAASPAVAEQGRALARQRPEKLVLRVDRADPSKNIVRGFEAYAQMLRHHPELHRRVGFLALLQPTRGDVAEYADYLTRIHAVVDSVNREFSTPGWQPIDLRLVDDLALAVAAYKEFDVLLVNPLADGMNLVVKEAAIVNERDGVLVLSERAGAHQELGAVVRSVDPHDVDDQARALFEALTLPESVRRARLAAAAGIVEANNMQKWLRYQLSDIELARGALSH